MSHILAISSIAILISMLPPGASFAAVPETVSPSVAAEKGCLSCHEGIERFSEGEMQETIESMGADRRPRRLRHLPRRQS